MSEREREKGGCMHIYIYLYRKGGVSKRERDGRVYAYIYINSLEGVRGKRKAW